MMLARIISTLANPVFILITLPYFLIYRQTNNHTQALNWELYTLIYIFIFCGSILIGVKKKIFSDIDISNKKQRPLIYFAGGLLATIYSISLYIMKGPSILSITTFGIILGITIASIINIKTKVSIHVASFAALTTALSIIYGGYFFFTLLLIPLISWARVKIKRHTTQEVITGTILGILLTLIMYAITIKLFAYEP